MDILRAAKDDPTIGVCMEEEGEEEDEGSGGGGMMSGPVQLPDDVASTNVESGLLVLEGKANESLGNVRDAVTCYKNALMADVFCEEALERLSSQHYLSAEEEDSLLSALPFKKQCSIEEEEFLRFYIKLKFKPCHLHHQKSVTALSLSTPLQPLLLSLDVQCCVATWHLGNQDTRACHRVCSAVLDQDPYHTGTLLVLMPCCVQEGRVEELFSLGHQLVKQFPGSPLSWYAIALYYFAVKRLQMARKYLTKCLSLDPHFVPAHLAFGASFASEGEHDHAVAAYSNASRLMRNSFWPLLYLGKEYFVTGSCSISSRFMRSAQELAPCDPSVLHEVAVVLYSAGEYEKAEKHIRKALSVLKNMDPFVTIQAWEPVYFNMGHVYRKLRKFDLALQFYQQSLQLCPNDPTIMSSIAFVHLLEERYSLAVKYCKRSLSKRREDQFTLLVLQKALEEEGGTGMGMGGGFVAQSSSSSTHELLVGIGAGQVGVAMHVDDVPDGTSSVDSVMTIESHT